MNPGDSIIKINRTTGGGPNGKSGMSNSCSQGECGPGERDLRAEVRAEQAVRNVWSTHQGGFEAMDAVQKAQGTKRGRVKF